MKKNSSLVSWLTILVFAAISYAFVSCHKDEPGTINVNGLKEASLTFEGAFNGKSGIDFKQTVNVTATEEWAISSAPNWVSVSPTQGHGALTMSIYPHDENTTSQDRSGQIVLSGENSTAIINVTQKNGKPVCYVTPSNIVALYNGIAWDYTPTGNVNKFGYVLLTQDVCNRLTDKELTALIKQESDEMKVSDDWVSMRKDDDYGYTIKQKTAYYIVTIAYDANDVAGELIKTPVTTPAFLNADKDAWVSFKNIEYSKLYDFFDFDAVKEGYCEQYHMIYGMLPTSANYNKAIYAFEINYYEKNGKKHWMAEQYNLDIVLNYPNNHNFYYDKKSLSTNPVIFAYGWGKFKDGTISSDLCGFEGNINNNAPAKKPRLQRVSDSEIGNQAISRRGEIINKKRN